MNKEIFRHTIKLLHSIFYDIRVVTPKDMKILSDFTDMYVGLLSNFNQALSATIYKFILEHRQLDDDVIDFLWDALTDDQENEILH